MVNISTGIKVGSKIMQRPSNPFVFTKKTVFMQRISDAVVNGSVRYIQGTIPVSKAGFFAAKMKDRYDYDLSYKQASRMRKLGYATSRLHFWHPKKGCLELHWILLATKGKFKDGVGLDENWLDPTYKNGRISVTNYRLVRIPSEFDTKPRWSWRYTRASYDGLRNNIVNAIRTKNDERLRQIIYNMYRSPCFGGGREQIKSAVSLIKDEWKRTRGSKEGMPEMPKLIGYVRRLEDKGVMLNSIKIQLEKIEIFSQEHLDDMSSFYDEDDKEKSEIFS